LWAIGEVSNTGLHGANRLASNSLLEAIVYGCRAGEGVSELVKPGTDCYTVLPLQNPVIKPHIEPLDLADIRNSLKSLMWRNVGVRRDTGGLSEAAENIARWCRYVLPRQFPDPIGWELQNMLCVSRLVIESAILREETRGCHVRTDFPEQDDQNWNRHQSFRLEAATS
jgi:L-aspartate oxidase